MMASTEINSIHNLETKVFENDSGQFPAIVMGLNIFDPGTVEPFLDYVVREFTSQRMCSPPDTANMTITIAGNLTAEEFCVLWNRRAATDPVLMQFMSTMVVVDVLRISGGDLLEQASLI